MRTWKVCRALVLATAGAVALAGCGYEGPGLVIRNAADFDRVALHNKKPTVVVFHKDGCSACGKLTPVIQTLAKEYDGRVTFAKCMILDLFFNVTSYELKVRYEVEAMPTVLVMGGGREQAHLVLTYNLADYRRVLNKALGVTGSAAPASGPATQPGTPPAEEEAQEPAGEPATRPASRPAATEPAGAPGGDG